MNRSPQEVAQMRRAWIAPPEGRVIGPGHPAGDLIGAPDWQLLREELGELELAVDLPDALRNPRGNLFGGFLPTYVDLVALLTARAGTDRSTAGWMMTANMSVEYLAPVTGPHFRIHSQVAHRGRRTFLIDTRFFGAEEELCAIAMTKLLAVEAP
ncbi:MAG: PaaI family thioesterase [Acidobacteriota bacterium]